MLIAVCISAGLSAKLNTHQICSHEMGPFGLTHCWSKDRSNWVIKVKGAFIEYTANMSVMFRGERQKWATAYPLGLQWSICLSVVSDPYFTPDRKNVLACQHKKIKSQGHLQNTGGKLKYSTNLRCLIFILCSFVLLLLCILQWNIVLSSPHSHFTSTVTSYLVD